jgi:hypothetical protein
MTVWKMGSVREVQSARASPKAEDAAISWADENPIFRAKPDLAARFHRANDGGRDRD